ncbi:MAG: YciI family protein [Alphaproteobacteria bacterium]
MPEFIVTYHGGSKPETPEEGAKMMAEWKAWSASLGSSLTNPGTPVGITKVVTAGGASASRSPNPPMGFSMVEADNLDAAVELVKGCPHLRGEGTMEVSEMMQMPDM